MNKEEVSIKITTPLFEKAELDLLDNYNETMHSMIEEYTKMYLEDKEKVITQRIIICQQQQLDQLTNNWNELEEWLKDMKTPKQDNFGDYGYTWALKIDVILDKMKEIKGNNNDNRKND